MDGNPYASPQQTEEPPTSNSLSGWAFAKDTMSLLFAGLVLSIIGVPVLFIFVAVLIGILQVVGLPLP